MFKTFALACLAAVASATETEHHNTGYYNVPGQYRGPGPLAGFVEEPKNFYDKRVDAPTVYRGGMRGRAGHKAYSKATGGRHGHQLYNYGSNQHGRFGQQFKSTYNPGGPRYGGAIADPGNKGAVPQNFQNPHNHRAGFHPGQQVGHDNTVRQYQSKHHPQSYHRVQSAPSRQYYPSSSQRSYSPPGYSSGQRINGQHPHQVYNFGSNKHGRIEQQFKSTSNPGGPRYGGAIADPGNKHAVPENFRMPHHHRAGFHPGQYPGHDNHPYYGRTSYGGAVAGKNENWDNVRPKHIGHARVDRHVPNSYRAPEFW